MGESVLNTRDGWLCFFSRGPRQACVISWDSPLSWQPCLILALLSYGRHACLILALPAHGRHAELISVFSTHWWNCTASDLQDKTWVPLCSGWVHALPKRLFTGHGGGRTVLLREGRGHLGSPPSEADDWRLSWEMGCGWKSSRGCQPAFQDLFSCLPTLKEHFVSKQHPL